ncbi:hypothetical protein cypCar_00006409, partial [Cyprinus carpio]
GEQPVLAVYQSIRDSLSSVWFAVSNEDSALVLRLLRGPAQNQAVLLRMARCLGAYGVYQHPESQLLCGFYSK